jgi:hypothetical protein
MAEGPNAGNSTTGTSSSGVADSNTQQNEQSRPPYAFWVVLVALGLSALMFVVVIWRFSAAFQDPVMAILALSTLLGIFGAVIGAYFAVTVTNDMAQRTIEQANKMAEQYSNIAERALAKIAVNEDTTHQNDQGLRSSDAQRRTPDAGKVS